VCEITGASYRQLDYWARENILAPSKRVGEGSGSHREYSGADVAVLCLMVPLVRAGMEPRTAVQVAHGLVTEGKYRIAEDMVVVFG
jgi:hypothetical protein